MHTQVIKVDAYPLVKRYIDQLGLMSIFKDYVPKGRAEIEPGEAFCVMITNILMASKPLYQIEEWLIHYTDPGDPSKSVFRFNDDCLARNLDRLFAAPRQEMLTTISLKAIKAYELECTRIHNDSTSITFTGDYKHQGSNTAQLLLGYNKDHHSDLKQLVFGLNLIEDGHVVIDYELYDGNRTDDTTHIDNWKRLRELLQTEEFLYIADSKLATQKNLMTIAAYGGKFISVLPKTRSEVTAFYEQLKTVSPDLKWACQIESSRKKGDFTQYHTCEQQKTREGFRLIWVHSSAKQGQDAARRQSRLQRIEKDLTQLVPKLNKYQLKTKEQISAAIQTILKKDARFFQIDLTEEKIFQRVQNTRGRPGSSTQYQEKESMTFRLHFQRNQEEITADSTKDGYFPLVTNHEALAREILQIYKNQPYLEKRFSVLKSITEVAPIYLKTPERIEAMIFLYFIALMIISLMERSIRNEMQKQQIESLKIRPNHMKTYHPTWNNIRYYFENIFLIITMSRGETDTTIQGLTKTHYQVSHLLGVKTDTWLDLDSNHWRFDSG